MQSFRILAAPNVIDLFLDEESQSLAMLSFSLRLNVRGQANSKSVDTSARKLLASRKQIDRFATAKQQGLTIVPTKLLTNGRFIKIVIALGRGKKRYDKRETIKHRDQDRETRRQLSGR